MEFLGLFVVVPDLRMKMSRISFLHDPQSSEQTQNQNLSHTLNLRRVKERRAVSESQSETGRLTSHPLSAIH